MEKRQNTFPFQLSRRKTQYVFKRFVDLDKLARHIDNTQHIQIGMNKPVNHMFQRDNCLNVNDDGGKVKFIQSENFSTQSFAKNALALINSNSFIVQGYLAASFDPLFHLHLIGALANFPQAFPDYLCRFDR